MKRILFLAANLCSGGAERQMVTVACLLKERGHDVTVYCYDSADFYADILRQADIPIVWDLTPKNYFKRIIKVRRFIRKGHFDAVISFLETCNLLNDIAAIGGKRWKVITGERSAKEAFFQSRRGIIFSWFQRYTDCIVCNSQNATKLWEKYYPCFSDKLFVVYNCVTLGKIDTNYEPIRDGRVHFLVAATYQYLKNPLGLAEALSLMTEEEKNRLVVDWYGRKEIAVGDDRAYKDFQKMVDNYNLSSILRLHDDTKDIANVMNCSDVVMLLSKFEGLPNVICEAMTIGKPILMSKVSDYRVLVDEGNGELCEWQDVNAIKNAIIRMSRKTVADLSAMANDSRKKAEKLFSKEEVALRWEKVISQY
ncbi:MAG: glycosyltransferase [Bacteroides sp.]|nr:glycosyltransferase [Bacteroides sp.]